ncbi:MAG: D-alanine--D-alanine ligase [bacterium]|nr:D-alanine--D-alanine ligase [bacterium]
MKTVGVLFGGRSGEHDVSLCSAASVVSALDRNKYTVAAIGIDRDGKWYLQDEPVIVDDKDFGRKMHFEKKGEWRINHFEQENKLVITDIESGKSAAIDIVFPVIHGTYCEDGTLQGLLELAMVPFVGADTAGSAIGMNKDVAKRLLRDGNIPVVDWKTVTKRAWDRNREEITKELVNQLGFPMFAKPANAGSSVGVKKIHNNEDMAESIEFAFRYDNIILVEKAVNAREIECAVLGNEEPKSSIPGEIMPTHEFYSYEAKYIDPEGARLSIPAEIDENLAERISELAVNAYKTLNCTGMARVDFFLEKESDTFYLNEINTIPGFTSISMYPKLWDYSGVGYSELLDRLIELALELHSDRMRIKTEL